MPENLLEAIAVHREAGHIATQRHPRLPLLIHNYTQRCQFAQAWNDVTLACRGLITDESGNIIARPFRKFFNVDEHGREGSVLPPINWNQPFYVSEKMDGSLGIAYLADDGPAIATRGSFVSDQAAVATEILRTRYRGWLPRDGLTYLYEIVFPENRIVVDYGPTRDLFLLDVIDNATGAGATRASIEKEAERMGCPVVRHLPGLDAAALAAYETGELNREWIVVRFEDGLRVKIKLAEYKRLHKLITGINARKIWECLSAGTEIDLERVPDEFFRWVTETKADLLNQHRELTVNVHWLFDAVRQKLGNSPRKDFAAEFLKHRAVSGLLFMLLDGKPIDQKAWQMVYPAHSVPWKADEVVA